MALHINALFVDVSGSTPDTSSNAVLLSVKNKFDVSVTVVAAGKLALRTKGVTDALSMKMLLVNAQVIVWVPVFWAENDAPDDRLPSW